MKKPEPKPEKKAYFTGENAIASYVNESNFDDTGTSRAERNFNPWEGNVSVRSDYNRGDYERFRPSERLPTCIKDDIRLAQRAYDEIGPIHNVIDTMGDFGSQGIRLQHEDPKLQEFYNMWADKVGMGERSERFLNLLYRHGNVIIKKGYADLPINKEKNWKKGMAEKNLSTKESEPESREIPWTYSFISPITVEVLGGDASVFMGRPNLLLKVTGVKGLIDDVKKMNSQVPNFGLYNTLVDRIPKELKDEIVKGKEFIPLDPTRTEIYYYKKDDWDLWAKPMIKCILKDAGMLDKMKQADTAALDGAISNVRLWRLGIIGKDAQTTMIPTKAQINLVRNILAKNIGGGVIDMVWGPDLDFKESNSQVWRFLGSEKYTATLNSIYEGLGIPSSLRGSGGSTNTGNFVGLKTMIKRLEYGRDLLTTFWQKELNFIHKAMGFAGKPPEIVFDYMMLADEAAEKQLFINLWDRDIIPTETIIEMFGRLPHIEKGRVKREFEERGKTMPAKASPYHNAEKEHDMNKALLGGGQVAPSELGIELKPKKEGEKSKMQMMEETQLKIGQQKAKEIKAAGRPKSVTETKKRKPKPTAKPSAKADVNLLMWTLSAQNKIHNIVQPALLHGLKKATARQLSSEEGMLVEYVKFSVLTNLTPLSSITAEMVIDKINESADIQVYNIAEALKSEFITTNDREPLIDELRQIYVSAYSIFHTSNDTE